MKTYDGNVVAFTEILFFERKNMRTGLTMKDLPDLNRWLNKMRKMKKRKPVEKKSVFRKRI